MALPRSAAFALGRAAMPATAAPHISAARTRAVELSFMAFYLVSRRSGSTPEADASYLDPLRHRRERREIPLEFGIFRRVTRDACVGRSGCATIAGANRCSKSHGIRCRIRCPKHLWNRPAVAPGSADRLLATDCSSTARRRATPARRTSAEYCFAEPFPHVVFDNFLPEPSPASRSTTFPRHALSSDRVFDMGYAGLHKRQILPEECDRAGAPAVPLLQLAADARVPRRADDDPGPDPRSRTSSAAAITRPGAAESSASTPTFASTSSSICTGASTSSSTSTRGGSRSGAARSSSGTAT